MKMRTALLGGAALLLAAAVFVELHRRSEFSRARPGPAVPERSADGGGPSEHATSAQDFALLELAIETTPEPYHPYAFVVDVRDPSGRSWTRVAEPSENGVALFGPLAPAADVRVAVVAGGARFGWDGESEVLGESAIRIGDRGGRHCVVVPARTWHRTDTRHRTLIVDSEGWPLAGARLTVVGAGVEVLASAHGYCAIDATGGREEIEVLPPPDRPELEPVRRTEDMELPHGRVTMGPPRLRDVLIDRLARDCLGTPVARAWLRAADSRAWVRSWNVEPDGRLAAVPFGRYLVSWSAGGERREARVSVHADAVVVDVTSEGAPAATVLVDGIPDPTASDAQDVLLLVERSERSCLLPTHVLASAEFEAMAGGGSSSWFAVARPDGNGSLAFEGVPPGHYEVRTRRRPRALSHCVEVPAAPRGPVRIAPEFQPRESRIRGTLAGQPQRKSWRVEARILGEFTTSQAVDVGGSYELWGLAPGIYSVWVSRSDWGPQAIRGEPLPESPWKNVRVDGAESVRLDFDVR